MSQPDERPPCPYCGEPAQPNGVTCGSDECALDYAIEETYGDPSLTDAERNEGADL